MKIIYLSRSMLPSKAANSMQVMKMCQALVKAGHNLKLVAGKADDCSLDYLFDYYGVKEKFTITLLKGRTDTATGLLIYLANFYFWIKKTDRPQIFYGRDLFTLTIAALVYKIPFFYEAHKPPSNFVYYLLSRLLINNKLLVKLVVITNSLKEEYLAGFPRLPGEKVLVAPDGADIPEQAVCLNPDQDKSGKMVVGYVGHLYPGRGIELILSLAVELPQFIFRIVGGRERDNAYWQNICRGVDNIEFTGFIPPKDLARVYAGIDLVLAPYQSRVSIPGGGDTSRWMSPLKIFEYMAFAKPIIASDLPALKEVLTDGVNALLCRPESTADWARAIRRLEQDTNLREQIAANAFASLTDKYTWDKRAARILGQDQKISHFKS